MLYINSFLFCGFVCLIGQIILDNTKLTPGHITAMFVVVGAFLDTFGIYDRIKQIRLKVRCFPFLYWGFRERE